MNITKAREQRGWSKADLAKRLAELTGGSSKGYEVTLSKYESGKSEPREETLALIKRALGGDSIDDLKAAIETSIHFLLKAHGNATVAKALRSLARDLLEE